MKGLQPKMETGASELERLATLVRADKTLYATDAERLLTLYHSPTNLQVIQDPAARERLEAYTPFGYAARAERARVAFTPAEWERVVERWAAYLDATAQAWNHADPRRFCGVGDSVAAMGVDAGYVVVVPLTLPPAAIISIPAGVLGLVGDVVALVPNTMAKALVNAPILRDRYFRRAAKAFDRFAKEVNRHAESLQ